VALDLTDVEARRRGCADAEDHMNGELVRVTTSDGVHLAGLLRQPASSGASTLPIDVIVLHHGVGGNFYNPGFIDRMAEQFLNCGCAVMRVNNRGHDLAYNSPAGRQGSAFETVDACRLDWKAWTDLAEGRGYGRIGLWGHSLGAVKTIYSLALDGDDRIVRAIASSPPRFSHRSFLAQEGHAVFEEYYAQATRLIEAGTPDALFSADVPTSLLMTARVYVDKYGPDERYDVVKYLPDVKVPMLVTIGGEEGVHADRPDRFGFGGLAEKVTALAERQPNLTFELIPGADHQYTNRTDQLWAAAERWLATK
jgi:alpha-beta hydrolase superfamily lysophospholipase